jgi:hypothetical protein
MLADAVSIGKTETVCTLLRTTFTGTLTITLPTTAAAWTTTNNIPLRLLIQDGTSGTPRPTNYIRITGVLALGSSIAIKGGDDEYSNNFILLPSGNTIQDGSSLTIKGGDGESAREGCAEKGAHRFRFTNRNSIGKHGCHIQCGPTQGDRIIHTGVCATGDGTGQFRMCVLTDRNCYNQ